MSHAFHKGNTEKLKKVLENTRPESGLFLDLSLETKLTNLEIKTKEMKKLLKEGADPNTVANAIGNGLFVASMCLDIPMWDLFVKYKTDPTARNEIGDTVLHDAVNTDFRRPRGKYDAVDRNNHGGREEYFFSHMLDYCMPILEFKSKLGSTALTLIASVPDDTFKTRILIERGANPNVRNRNGQTPLLAALADRSFYIVSLLVRHGADVNAMNEEEGYTPLLLAMAMSDTLEFCKLLLDNGANVNAKIGKMSLLQIALSSEKVELRDFFRDWITRQHRKATVADFSGVPNTDLIFKLILDPQ
jgi:hypothetical protein